MRTNARPTAEQYAAELADAQAHVRAGILGPAVDAPERDDEWASDYDERARWHFPTKGWGNE